MHDVFKIFNSELLYEIVLLLFFNVLKHMNRISYDKFKLAYVLKALVKGTIIVYLL